MALALALALLRVTVTTVMMIVGDDRSCSFDTLKRTVKGLGSGWRNHISSWVMVTIRVTIRVRVEAEG